MLQASVGSVPSSANGSTGSHEDPLVVDDDEDDDVEIIVRVEREETRVPSRYPRTLVEVVELDQSIDQMEEAFMEHAGVMVPRELRWPPLDEVVPSSEVGELTEEERGLFRDFAEEEREQVVRDLLDPGGLPEMLVVEAAAADPAPPYEPRPAHDFE